MSPAEIPRGFVQRLGRPFAACVAVAITAFAIEVITEESLASEVTSHMAARLFAPYDGFFYGFGSDADEVSRRFLVVNFGQPSLDRLGTRWPITYGQHARILESLRRSQPKAVFIDFHFQSERQDPTFEGLGAVLRAYRNDGIPVFLAAGSGTDQVKLIPKLESLLYEIGTPYLQKVSVTYQPSEIDRITWAYRLHGEGEERLPSAALALARVITGQTLVQEGDPEEMGLVWAGGSVDTGPSWKEEALPASGEATGGGAERKARHYCRPPAVDDIVPLHAFLRRVTGYGADTRPNCPRHDTVEAFLLTAPKTPDQAEALDNRIRGRAVLYGGSIDPNEFVASPLHGDIPGVYLHAQAADNLVRFGKEWLSPEMGGRQVGHLGHLLTFLALLALAVALAVGRALLGRLAGRLARLPGVRSAIGAAARLPDALSKRTDGSPRWPKGSWAETIAQLAGRGLKAIGETFGKLGLFYISLLLAVPLSLAMERLFQVSVIGYGSVLALCLLGELVHLSGSIKKPHADKH